MTNAASKAGSNPWDLLSKLLQQWPGQESPGLLVIVEVGPDGQQNVREHRLSSSSELLSYLALMEAEQVRRATEQSQHGQA
jgi:hypothetical protein